MVHARAHASRRYDLDASGMIDMAEMQAIVKEVYGNNFRTSIYAQRIMEKIHKLGGENGTAEISREQFHKFAAKHPALLFPAFQLQNALQKKIMGVRFWDAAARKRNKNFGSAVNLQVRASRVAGLEAAVRCEGRVRNASGVPVRPTGFFTRDQREGIRRPGRACGRCRRAHGR